MVGPAQQITVGFGASVYTTTESEGTVDVRIVVMDPSGGTPRPFSLSVTTQDNTAGSFSLSATQPIDTSYVLRARDILDFNEPESLRICIVPSVAMAIRGWLKGSLKSSISRVYGVHYMFSAQWHRPPTRTHRSVNRPCNNEPLPHVCSSAMHEHRCTHGPDVPKCLVIKVMFESYMKTRCEQGFI